MILYTYIYIYTWKQVDIWKILKWPWEVIVEWLDELGWPPLTTFCVCPLPLGEWGSSYVLSSKKQWGKSNHNWRQKRKSWKIQDRRWYGSKVTAQKSIRLGIKSSKPVNNYPFRYYIHMSTFCRTDHLLEFGTILKQLQVDLHQIGPYFAGEILKCFDVCWWMSQKCLALIMATSDPVPAWDIHRNPPFSSMDSPSKHVQIQEGICFIWDYLARITRCNRMQ